MQYRLLDMEEWDRLRNLIPEEYLPPPEAAACAVAEDDSGEIQGALFLQLQLHMEPLVLRHPSVSFKRLHEALEEAIKERKGLTYFARADQSKVSRMCQLVGMEMYPGQLWQKKVV